MIRPNQGRDVASILPMGDYAAPPRPSGYSRMIDRGIAVDVRTWSANPAPACRICAHCTAGKLQNGDFQCVILGSTIALPGA